MKDYAERDWLIQQSMLETARRLAQRYAGQGRLWQTPYSAARPRDAAERASVWFTAYPPSIITGPDRSVLQVLGDEKLWESFAAIGIEAIHTGPMKRAGGLTGRSYTPTIDGHFDRIGLDIDPQFGTVEEYQAMCAAATSHSAVVIDDIVPGHTGKGADFRLAERGWGDYPGIYHMVEIPQEDWALLPAVPAGHDAVNLPPATVDLLRARGYIVGRLSRVIFYEPGIKETNWSATPVVEGDDGVARRWVYLHYFKAGQPTLNWLDPTFAGPRLVIGDAIHSLDVLGASMLRLDANGFLGVEARAEGPAWSEGHPLSLTGNRLIAGLVRKLGGFTFQELNLTVDDIAAMSDGAADLAYDFITRPAYQHALVTGNTEFLQLMLRTLHEYSIDPASLVHALQNHDELTLELVHFWTRHSEDRYEFDGRTLTGSVLRDEIRAVMYGRLTGDSAPYNLRFVTNGVASTTVSVIAAALGIPSLDDLTPVQIAQIRQVHLLLVMYNAMQPGIFALSGWDLVGALPLRPEQVAERLEDGDTRWINRGAYDLVDLAPGADAGAGGLPRARSLYGSLPAQLARPDSFAARLRNILAARKRHRLYAAEQLPMPDVRDPALLVLLHRLPDDNRLQMTALNFGADSIEETVSVAGAPAGPVFDMVSEEGAGRVTESGTLTLSLPSYTGRALLLPRCVS